MTTQAPTAAAAAARLDALAVRIDAIPGLTHERTSTGVRIRNPAVPGCCEFARRRADHVTCRRRPDDFNELWFWTSWGEPITRADDVVGASVRIIGYLGPLES
ncbi:hypothetical protein [Actinomadura geliboluensis]|uniref:hypothetical protein n=1 Tax=Actinomadura geliboluensis TaxID=882440 RepID=UPI0026190039|nr:hypothetical protein [Actinomadura geliboluensis]